MIGIVSLTYLLNIPLIMLCDYFLLKNEIVRTKPLSMKKTLTQKGPSNRKWKYLFSSMSQNHLGGSPPSKMNFASSNFVSPLTYLESPASLGSLLNSYWCLTLYWQTWYIKTESAPYPLSPFKYSYYLSFFLPLFSFVIIEYCLLLSINSISV